MKCFFLPMGYGFFALFLIGLVPCLVMGQVLTKKSLVEADYCLWNTLESVQLSSKGTWVQYRLAYENHQDTLFVVPTKSKKKYVFPLVTSGVFVGDACFVYKKHDTLVRLSLDTGLERKTIGVSDYGFSSDGNYWITVGFQHELVVRFEDRIVDVIYDVTAYQWDATQSHLIYSTYADKKGSVGCLTLHKKYKRTTIVAPCDQQFGVLKWQPNGRNVAFYGLKKEHEVVFCYDMFLNKLFSLKSTDFNFPEGMKIAPNQNIALKVSRDGKKVFFGITHREAKDTTALLGTPEIWNAGDQKIFRDRKLIAGVSHPQYLAVWFVEESQVRQISSAQQDWVALTGNQEYALLADSFRYEPRYTFKADLDYYLLNLRTGKQDLILQKQSGFDEQLNFSPDGRYISYYKAGNWWVYDITNRSHTNVTGGIHVSWDNSSIDSGGELVVWGQPGWTKDGSLICYDYYDVWVISVDGKKQKRLTHGAEKQLQFRLDTSAQSTPHDFNYSDTGIVTYDLSRFVFISVLDLYGGATGYYELCTGNEPTKIVMENALISRLKKSEKSSSYVYLSQDYDSPPQLLYSNGNATKVIAVSNPQHSRYKWGTSKMIHYNDSKGHLLNGILYYPFNYEVGKQYPMVVFVYESLSRGLHAYINPSLNNGIGFNITHLLGQGYAVLLPDIVYEKGSTGISATDCVTSAVQKVIAMGVADAGRIGLIGHSFGGYETNFIISQTHLFAAAVSGSAVSDTVGHYFTINTDYNTIDGWRYEHQQYRMGSSFFEHQEAYYSNSPVLNASTINTPLLTWAGKLDQNVQPRQAETFYAALRRLNKSNIMMVYDDEGHIFTNPKNQQDLTRKIDDWFGYYLKRSSKAGWMLSDRERQ